MSRDTIVDRCMECPFMLCGEDDIDGECLREHTVIDVDIELGRPDWCPLNDGPITIKAGEP